MRLFTSFYPAQVVAALGVGKKCLESKVSASSVCSKRWPGSQAVYELYGYVIFTS